MKNTLYADIDRLQADIQLLRGGIYCKVKVEELEAEVAARKEIEDSLQTEIKRLDGQVKTLENEVARLHKGWTEANIMLTNAESENETLRRDNEFLAGVVGYELERVRP